MIFDKLRLVGANNVDFPILGADASGPFVLKSAEGLDPPEIFVAYASTVNEGGVRQKTKAQNRQVIARVGLQPDWDTGQTAQELRTTLYGLLTPKYGLPLIGRLMLGSTVVGEIQGDISRFEASIFSKDPEVQITMNCDGPHILAPAILYQTPEKSIVSGKTAIDVLNDGTASVGFWMSITFQSVQNATLVLSDDSANGQHMDITENFEAGDKLTLDTRPGQRGVWKTLSGESVKSSILNSLTGESPWMELHGGDNRLLLNNTAFDWAGNGFGHTPAYWGV